MPRVRYRQLLRASANVTTYSFLSTFLESHRPQFHNLPSVYKRSRPFTNFIHFDTAEAIQFERMKKLGKSSGSRTSGKSSSERSDRKSGTGMNGSPKKGGHGGKYTWSGDGYSQAEISYQPEAIDAKDPNYEDPEETVIV